MFPSPPVLKGHTNKETKKEAKAMWAEPFPPSGAPGTARPHIQLSRPHRAAPESTSPDSGPV